MAAKIKKGDETRSDIDSSRAKKAQGKLVKWLLIYVGTFFLGIGIIGIFVPILPTTPLLLLAAACYARSSERFYNWLLNNKWVGNYIKNYREGRGISLKSKILILSLLWIVILFSAFFFVPVLLVQVILILVALGVTAHVLSIRTFKE